MKICPRDWENKLERMNMRVDEDNGRVVGMGNGRLMKFQRFSGNEFWKKFCCLFLAPTFGIGGLRLWEKEEEQRKEERKGRDFPLG